MRLRLKKQHSMNPVKWIRTVEPSVDPVDLIDVKDRLLVTQDDDDADLQLLIEEATAECEEATGLALITQTRTVWHNRFPILNSLKLGTGPVQYISKITLHLYDGTSEVIYLHNPDDDTNDLNTDKYFVTNSEENAAITLNRNTFWDTRSLRPKEGIEIQFVCGFGDESQDVPSALRGGIMAYIKFYYQMEEEAPLPSAVTRPWNYHSIVDK